MSMQNPNRHWEDLSDEDLVHNTADALEFLARGLGGRESLTMLQSRIGRLAEDVRRFTLIDS